MTVPFFIKKVHQISHDNEYVYITRMYDNLHFQLSSEQQQHVGKPFQILKL